ncbi:MAG: hypothetical protein Q7S22_04845 [Candidatus Micrarchaeota archaeon]|nr:hypothetical protein [Candidatus Micrarchaeota archaeon]
MKKSLMYVICPSENYQELEDFLKTKCPKIEIRCAPVDFVRLFWMYGNLNDLWETYRNITTFKNSRNLQITTLIEHLPKKLNKKEKYTFFISTPTKKNNPQSIEMTNIILDILSSHQDGIQEQEIISKVIESDSTFDTVKIKTEISKLFREGKIYMFKQCYKRVNYNENTH